jgi:hypothetical protein
MALLCRQPVSEANAQFLHTFDATNTGSQVAAEKTAVGRFICEPAHSAKAQIEMWLRQLWSSSRAPSLAPSPLRTGLEGFPFIRLEHPKTPP